MAGRRTNIALFVALALSLATGGLAFAVGTSAVRWILIAHGVAGLAIVLLTPWKSVIARRGLTKRRGGTSASIAFTALVAISVLAGIAHSAGLLRAVGPVSVMQIHVGTALAAIPLLVFHVMARPARWRATDISRRNLVRAAGLATAGIAVYAAKESVVRLASTPGAARRYTGSYERGSFRPELMPVTQWLNDSVQVIEADDFVLTVDDRTWSFEELARWRDRVRATIDCTGGWYSEQDWEGVRLDRLIEQTTTSVAVVSRTGYQRLFPANDIPNLLLATRVGEEFLSAGHGGPLRLVAPGRRGFWWVKWVDHIARSDRPWWLQPPFPLT
jgi:hypothetical protein